MITLSEIMVIPAVLVVLAVISWCLMFIKLPTFMESLGWLGKKGAKNEDLLKLGKRLEALSIPITAEVFTACRMVITILPVLIGSIIFFTKPITGFFLLATAPLLWRIPNHLLVWWENKRKEHSCKEIK